VVDAMGVAKLCRGALGAREARREEDVSDAHCAG
jgi:hypothetical protein